jgi:signal transduction histidine kinase
LYNSTTAWNHGSILADLTGDELLQQATLAAWSDRAQGPNLVSRVLHDFIVANREEIIERARQRVRERTASKSSEARLEHGVPLFLSQLADALRPVSSPSALHLVTAQDDQLPYKQIGSSAGLHGHELLENGFTVAQVVHGYGDVCQIVTELATEKNAAITSQDFHIFNRCLDDAIAGAVTAYGDQRERDLAYEGTERLGVLAHELRNMLSTAVLSFDVMKKGLVGLGGSTSAVHARSLAGLRGLVERSLAEVRLEAGMPRLERVSLVEFMEEIEVNAALQAEGHGLHLTVNHADGDAAIDADKQLLASAVLNLLQNAFKFSRAKGEVTLATRATADRVFIDVSDECGGLPPGKAEELFRPFTRRSTDSSGLGLGLAIALSAARANSGDLHVRDVPGKGCVFTIDLPRRPPPASSIFRPLPDGEHGSSEASGDGPRRGAHSRDPNARAV